MSEKELALRYLQKALGTSGDFRSGQWESIEQLLAGKRLLVVERTGWGKSMVYFLTTRILRDRGRGPTLLISPLLSLMRNQLEAAARIGIRARTINRSNSDDWDTIERELTADSVDILLVSSERLSNSDFREILSSLRIGMLVIDEAHCISDWGHDFRPDYRLIRSQVEAMPPNLPILATTATANDRVIEDIKVQLGENLTVQKGSLVRTSLHLQNISIPSTAGRLAWLAHTIPSLPGSGIVYTLTVRDTELVSGWLQAKGINAKAYSGELPTEQREELETALIRNNVKVLAATTALGMGFDKPDLGFVIHFQRPASVVHYYQQVGRAGRGIESARGVLLNGNEDEDIVQYFIESAFPPQAHITCLLDILKESESGLTLTELQERLNLAPSRLQKTLKFLMLESPSPVTRMPDSKRYFATQYAYGYKVDTEYIKKITEIRYREQDQMREYMNHKGCLMRFLQDALNDESGDACGKCQNCSPSTALPESYPSSLAIEANNFLRRNNPPIHPRKQWPSRKRITNDLRAEEGWALCLWKDGGWGDTVADGKYRLHQFPDELVDAFTAMLKERFPIFKIKWVTCVPSLRERALVPDFARKVAGRLGLPFRSCVIKTHETQPQKTMLNSSQQFKNIEDAFQITQRCSGACLLIDDVVNSGWTFTLISARLREAGCSAVYPAALAKLR